MRNAAPRLRARLQERLRTTGEDAEVLSLRQLKEEFGLDDGERLTQDRREHLQRWLDAADVAIAPRLTSPERPKHFELRTDGADAAAVQTVRVPPRDVRAKKVVRTGMSRSAKLASGFGLVGTLLVLVVLELPAVVDRLVPDPPTVLRGDLNVAVAKLSAPKGASDDESAEIDALSDVLQASVRKGITAARPAEGLRVAFRGPDELESLDRSADAASLAKNIRADFVVYGEVRREGPELRVIPRFWVAPRLVQQATELTGAYSAGEPLSARDVTTNIAAREQIRRGVADRARGLAFLMVGLSHYVLTDYRAAARTLDAADGTGGLEGPGGRKLLGLFDGNIALKAADYKEAEAQYRRVLDLDPRYHRAHLGLADVLFASSRRGCGPSTNLEGIARAEEQLRSLRIDTGALDAATARARQRFGLGRVTLCRLLAGAPGISRTTLGTTDGHFRAVIAAAPEAAGTLDEAASESYGSLGLMRWTFGAGRTDASAREALALYRSAFRLSRRDDRRALYLRRTADMLTRLGRDAEAATNRRRADSLERLGQAAAADRRKQ